MPPRIGAPLARYGKLCDTLFRGRQAVGSAPFFVIAGLNVLECPDEAQRVAEAIATTTSSIGLPAIFKASFDKANRTAPGAFRGRGMQAGLQALQCIKTNTGLPILTDVHETWQVAEVAETVDVLQIPAFLCRQTDLIEAAAATGRALHIKKAQFASPEVAVQAVSKAQQAAPVSSKEMIMVCERGYAFGYGDLVVDMRSLTRMRAADCPVVMDATHAAQRPPTGPATASGGRRQDVLSLARAAVAVGVDGVFLEVHRDPATAPVDSGVQWPLGKLGPMLAELTDIAYASRWRADTDEDQDD